MAISPSLTVNIYIVFSFYGKINVKKSDVGLNSVYVVTAFSLYSIIFMYCTQNVYLC